MFIGKQKYSDRGGIDILKVLVADDEIKVGKLMESLIHWEELEMVSLGVVENGSDAYEMLKNPEKRPDIIITDIRMPGMDGLELIAAANELNLDTSFVVISGYKQFEYAQSAIKYGVKDYLLKPVSEDELNSILKKISDEKVIKNQEKLELERKSIEVGKARNILQKNLLEHILTGYIGKVEEINADYFLKFREGIFQAVAIRIDAALNRIPDARQDAIVLECIKERLQKAVAPIVYECALGLVDGKTIVMILNYSMDSAGKVKEAVNNLIVTVNQYIEGFNCYKATLGVGKLGLSFEEILNSVRTAIKCIQARILVGTGKSIDWERSKWVDDPQPDKSSSYYHKLQQYVLAFDAESLKNLIETAYKEISGNGVKDPNILYATADGFVEKFYKTLPVKIGREEQDERKRLTDRLENCNSIECIVEQLVTTFYDRLEILKRDKAQALNKPIKEAIDYIGKHFAEKITLDDVAKKVFLNPVYLCTAFKKETGKSFNDYLVEIRVEAAKELLRKTNATISSISNDVGYKDVKYFTHVFKKNVGVKPSQYRKLCS